MDWKVLKNKIKPPSGYRTSLFKFPPDLDFCLVMDTDSDSSFAVHISECHTYPFFFGTSPMKSKGRSRDESNMLASRDKHSVVRSFQASLKEDIKLSQQRSSRHRVHKNERDVVQIKSKAPGVPFDADKLAKDAGGRYLFYFVLCV